MSFADKVSFLRILLIPFFIASLVYFNDERPFLQHAAIAVFGLAVLSDFFDGLLARIKKEKSEFGKLIDPLADKLLLLTAFIALYALRHSLPLKFQIPLGVVLVVVSRDFIILLGVIVFHLLKLEVPIDPSLCGKITTFLQMSVILSVLTEFSLTQVIWVIAVICTIISGVGYIIRGVQSINASNTLSG